ncbi:MAG TPA: DegT/DnrJ/EryC1/StrS family aminotransferase [Acidimicrobiales bacterium]|nr:DegT/DnrJ/EryC1/StrS family aminotransferase [Acidimicrobiales bacterium]
MKVTSARVVYDDQARAEVARLVDETLQRGSLTLGPITTTFEEEFASRHAAARAVAVSSGTAALEIIFRALGVDGREVVVPANTFYATAGAVIHAGGRPVFADVDPRTLALDPASLRAVIGPDTAAVALVHIGGLVAPAVEEIRAICDDAGVALVEDAAHAHGSSYRGRPAGTFGAAGAFSFYPTKVVASSEGGMIVTGDERVAAEALIYRDQGKASFGTNDHVRLGYAWRMGELSAAAGLVSLRRLDEAISVRRSVARRYDEALSAVDGITVLDEPEGCVSNYYKYVALLPAGSDRDALKKVLREEYDVSLSGEVYATPLHLQSVLAPYATGPLPVAEDVCARQVCLPVHSDMTDAEVDHVVSAFTAACDRL